MVPQLDYLLAYIMGFWAMIHSVDLDDEDFGEDDHNEWCEMMVQVSVGITALWAAYFNASTSSPTSSSTSSPTSSPTS
jgi:hypothetical protein